jgi:hypothetical protein
MLHRVLNSALDIRRDERELEWSKHQNKLRAAERERYMNDALEVREAYEEMKDPREVKVSSPTTKRGTKKTLQTKKKKKKGEIKSSNSHRPHRITLMTFLEEGKPPCCPNAHNMEFVNKSNAPYRKFVCDEKQCSRKGKDSRWHCKPCGLDYCLNCYPAPSSNNITNIRRPCPPILSNDDENEVDVVDNIDKEEKEEKEDGEVSLQYDESALFEIPVELDQTDFRPTWYHDTSHIHKDTARHGVYFKKSDVKKNKKTKKRERGG